jgi:mannose-6-phosphate isomerase-like protein (cupin superfamily)
MTVFVECPAGAYPFFHRETDQDVIYFQYQGTSTVETEFGVYEIKSGEMLLIPRGISQRTIGSPDCLRWALYYKDPVGFGVDIDNPTLEYEIQVRRTPDIRYEFPTSDRMHGVRSDGRIREVIRVREHPEDDTWLWRTYESLVGCGTQRGREIKKFGLFNYFRGMTGKESGPPITPVKSPTIRIECFNTVGEMTAGFHRGADSEEMWIQFGGSATNESEFGQYMLGTSEMAYVPKGIAHHVIGLDGYIRCTLYARNYMRQLVTDTDHVTESVFEVEARVRELQPVG